MAESPVETTPPEPADAGSAPPAARSHRRRWVFAAVGLAVVAAAVWAVRRSSSPASSASSGPDAQARPVPVVVTSVLRRDVPVSLEGLGNVVAYKTVTVRPQVDGRLDQVLFKEGQTVKAGQVLAQIDPRPFRIQLDQAEGALARDTAQLVSARHDLERYRALAAEKLIAQQQADAQVATVGQLEGAVRIDQASVATARLNLDYARISSPVDGVTGIRLVDPGNVVHASDPGGLVIVTQLDPIAVIFTLPQDQLPAVTEAMSHGPLAVDVFGREGAAPIGTGRLELVDNQINQATSTIRLKAVLPNPRHLLWPNQFVKARLNLSVERGALVVPATALQRGPNGTFVYVVGADATAAPRPVEIASTQGDSAVIARGLSEGERVVVDGQAALRSGSKVTAREAGQPATGAGAPAASDRPGAPAPAGAAGAPAPAGRARAATREAASP
jgi:multidrug efflux system membrane fusion protein